MSTSNHLSQTLADLKRSMDSYGSVESRRKGGIGRLERLVNRVLRRPILRHLYQQREINHAVVCALDQLADAYKMHMTPHSTDQDLTAFLGLTADPLYVSGRERLRQSVLDRLHGCSPEGATPAEMDGYIGEASLRFGATIELLRPHIAHGLQVKLLEIGSNPYFLTLMLKDNFPDLVCTGVNYFEGSYPVQSMQRQLVNDPQGRLSEVSFFHANVEEHSLEALRAFDVCLFCEVIEHLPFDPAWALYNIVRTLRLGGILLLTTPNPARLENLEKMIRHRATFSDPVSGYGIHGRHNREYSASELVELCSETGLTILNTHTIDVVPTLYSRDAEAKGFGAYHMILARLDETARLFRPAWLYRSFAAERLASRAPLIPGK